jgi:limonene-1,2-epoxide hydrolase
LLASTETDWLVISTMPGNGLSAKIRSLQARFPSIRILAIAADGSEVLINWMEPQEVHMEKATLPELIAMMRKPKQQVAG